MLESKYQAKVIKQLRSEGYYVIRIIQASVAGIPDLIAMKAGETRLIEVKAKRGVLSKIQQYRHEELRAHGLTVEVWKSGD